MWWLLHDSLVASHTNNRHDCIVHDDISKEKMFENQNIKMYHVMYEPKSLAYCHSLPELFQVCSKLPCRKKNVETKMKMFTALHLKWL